MFSYSKHLLLDKLERPELHLTRERIESVLDDPEDIIDKNETEF
jgi:hypothetical protein